MRFNMTRGTNETVLHGVGAIVGLALLLAPWLAGFAAATAAVWNAVIVGALILALGIAAAFGRAAYEGYGYLALGLWTAVAPWALGFSGLTPAVYAHVGAGAVAAAIGALALWFSSDGPYSAT